MKRIAVIGAGNWGTALAVVAARKGHDVVLWSRSAAIVTEVNDTHINQQYLPGVELPTSLIASSNLQTAVAPAELVIMTAPSHATRGIMTQMSACINEKAILVSGTKGIEIETGKRISEIAMDVLGQDILSRFVCLSGPSFANEVVSGHPTAIVAASLERDVGHMVQTKLSFENLRIYANDDVIGTELGGSVKNVMAIAAGMVAGLGYGTNSIAALITRGLAEMSRLTIRAGGKLETMMGLAGLGDLVLTCTGELSRNRRVGVQLGKGRTLDQIISESVGVAEGVKTTRAVRDLASRLGVEMPITNQVHAVLYEGKSVKAAANELMSRPLRDEAASA